MSKIGKKIKRVFAVVANALGHGMAVADAEITNAQNTSDESHIVQHVGVGGVLNDMMEMKVTDEVKEVRDTYYRVLREADKYHVELSGSISEDEMDNENAKMFASVKKKTKEDFMQHPPVFEQEGYKLRTIQDNKHIMDKSNFDLSTWEGKNLFDLYDYQTTLTVERDGVTPRFKLDKFVTRMVVRNKINSNRAMVDFYLPTIASQFGKIDAILISNLYRMFESKDYRSDFAEFTGIEWYSDKAWNAEDVSLFKYDDIKLVDMNIFDGNFVLSFDCHVVNDGKDLAEQFKTKELDEKYATMAPKKKAIDLFTLERNMDKIKKKEVDLGNLESTTIDLK